MKWIFGSVLSILVLLLSWQNHRLRGENERLAFEASRPKPGLWASHLQRNLGSGAASGTVGSVFVFLEPNCRYSNASLPALRELSATVKAKYGSKFAFTGVSRSATRHRNPGFRVVTTSDAEALSYSKFYGTPLIVLTNRKGVIIYSRFGLLSHMEDATSLLDAMAFMDRKPAPLT